MKFCRANENGEYESIPESVELLPLEAPESLPSNVPILEQNEQNEDIKQRTDEVVIKEEPVAAHEEMIWRPDGYNATDNHLNEEENGDCEESNTSMYIISLFLLLF